MTISIVCLVAIVGAVYAWYRHEKAIFDVVLRATHEVNS